MTAQAAAGQDSTTAFNGPTEFFADWLERLGTDAIFARMVEALFILLLVWAALYALKRFASRWERKLDDESQGTLEAPTQRAQTVAQLAQNVGQVVVVATGLLLLLNLVVPIGPLLAGVGVFGLAISFGAQSLVKDIISGFFLLSENQFAVGDVIEIEGVSGVVERLTLRVVMLRDVRGVLHTIPNGSIVKVSNKTRGWSRALVEVGVAYKEDLGRVTKVLESVLAKMNGEPEWGRRFLAEPRVWGVEELADSAIVIRLAVETRPGKQWEVRREILRRVKDRFDAEGIEIPFPQRTVHTRGPKSV